ncbi:GTPase Era [Taklimakanibacter albus]|uniref:GTPase Era n=1 Tax=Taklimakanibacter albus TaxID=2800327 RepID=A0ACC5R1V1_9HYPH|nr:GTPase Era [Aestuariivirga sp. YIM B02566]
MTETVTETRCGFCAIIGAPNAGKSTLVNALAGVKISIVSHKVQTTRSRLRAIVIAGQSQIIFVDTPGIFKPKRTLDEAMVEGAWAGASEADAIVLLTDVRKGLNDEVLAIIDGLKKNGRQAFLALNKIDLVKAETLLDLAQKFNEAFAFRETFMISALNKSGIGKLKDRIAGLMPQGPWLYAEDQIADVPLRFLAAETTREKLYERLHEELPYASTVETETWEERKDGSVRIDQVIYVERDSQKKIVLGKNGQTIKALGQAARLELEKAFERRVHLFLFVKVRENWAKDPERLRMMGLLD